MAIVSSHILDSVSGGSAAGIRVELVHISDDGKRSQLFDVVADAEGRISETVDLSNAETNSEFELIFHCADYFSELISPVMKCAVIRFSMTDADKRYHIPVMLAPHSYSTWCSA